MTREDIARICHEVNRAYCQSQGDHSQLPWEEAPQWARDSALKGVNLHIDNPNSTPADSHISWMNEKVSTGWVYGPEKNPDASPPTHHCLVPFEQLPAVQQAKDHIFRGVCHALRQHLEPSALELASAARAAGPEAQY